MKNTLAYLIILLFASCRNPQPKPAEEKIKMVFRFELDSAGNITNQEVKQDLIALAKRISKNADRLMLNAYSEQTGSKEKNEQIAFDMSYAAKRIMLLNAERAYYNVGVNVVGYGQPVNANNPADIQNRRIEFEYITP